MSEREKNKQHSSEDLFLLKNKLQCVTKELHRCRCCCFFVERDKICEINSQTREMPAGTRDEIEPILDQRHARATLLPAVSVISNDSFTPLLPTGTAFDLLEDIYTSRHHRLCVDRSYLTLLAMTLAVIFWITYWFTWTRCANRGDAFLCDLVVIWEVCSRTCACLFPLLLALMIYTWMDYSCRNRLERIRDNHLEIQLEDQRWFDQVNEFYRGKKLRCCSRRRRELEERGFGHIILSPHGILLDELTFFNTQKNRLDHGIVLNNRRILRLVTSKTCRRPWSTSISLHLPPQYLQDTSVELLRHLLKIEITIQ